MASRQLRKLRQQQDLLKLQNEAGDGSEGSEDEPIVSKPRGNMFSGFAALGDTGDSADDDEEEAQKSETENAQQSHQEQDIGPTEPAKKSKKKSKKKKKKGKQTESPAPVKDEHESIDEIDRVLEELKLEARQTAGPSVVQTPVAGGSTSALDELLRINFQHLKAMNEMRRVFGKAMDVAEVEERTQDNRQRGLPPNVDLETFLSARASAAGQGPQATKGMFDTILRTNPFVDGKKTWPRDSGQRVKMSRVAEGQQEEVEFAFSHDTDYSALETKFFGLVQMYDPMQLVYFLHRYPYHVSSLIQVSKVARQDQNSALAADLIERALFAFGRATLSEFRKKLEKGQARMSFARPENRQFYLAGFNQIQKLTMKGTYRTALEWAKLFLSINHDDPYAMINWIPVLAIRAREAEWLINLCNSDLFNNPQLTSAVYAKQTVALAYFQLKDTATAKSTLIKGMETVPWLFCALFSALNLDTPKSIWGIQPRDQDETLHTELYIHTAKDLWNTPQHISLLNEAAAATTRPADPATLPSTGPVSLATARFVYLDNTPALMASVPRQMLHSAVPNFDFDPLPPPKDQNIFSDATQQLPWTATENDREHEQVPAPGGGGGGGGGGGRREGLQAAVARLREEIEREMEARGRRRDEDAVRRAAGAIVGGQAAAADAAAAAAAAGTEQEGQQEGQEERERRFLPREPPAPGLMNYLRYMIQEELQLVDEVEDWQAPTGMPGGWGQGEGWEEEDDFEGEDAFEGGDDFEGGGRDQHGSEPEAERR